MNEAQFEILTAGLDAPRTEAARLVIFGGMSDGEAEREAHGQKTRTVRRDIKRMMRDLCKAEELVNAGVSRGL